ncbi:MAG: hypothetical protein QM758_15310 [Armatimonas sp.]
MAEPILDIFALFGPIPPAGAVPGTDALRATHSKHGVAGAVALSTRGIYHAAPAGNRETAALCQQSGGSLLPAAVLDPRVPRFETNFPGARLLSLFPATQNWPVRWLPFTHALKTLAESGVKIPLLFEATRPGDLTAFQEVLEKSGYNTAVVLVGIDDPTLSEAIAFAKGNSKVHLATDGLVGIGQLALVVEHLGAERLVFGSGAIARNALSSALAVVRAAGFDDNVRGQIFANNAKRLLASGGAS